MLFNGGTLTRAPKRRTWNSTNLPLAVPPTLPPKQFPGLGLAAVLSAPRSWQGTVWVIRIGNPELPPIAQDGHRSTIEYGNVTRDLADRLAAWNGFDSAVDYVLRGVSGDVASLALRNGASGGALLPVSTVAPGGELLIDAELDPSNLSPVIDLVIEFDANDMTVDSFSIAWAGFRARVFPWSHNWREGLTIRRRIRSQVFSSDHTFEQRVTPFGASDSVDEILGQYLALTREDGIELIRDLEEAKHRPVIVPWYPEPLTGELNEARGILSVSSPGLDSLTFQSEFLVALDSYTRKWQVRRVLEIDSESGTVQLTSVFDPVSPVTVFYFGRRVFFESARITSGSDSARELQITWSGIQ